MIGVVCISLLLGGCYTKSEYMQKVAEADGKAKELETLQQQYKILVAEKEALKAQKDDLDKRFKTESSALSKSVTDLQGTDTRLRGEIEQLRKKSLESNRKAPPTELLRR
jgi:Tfp pilus assembly protein PilO